MTWNIILVTNLHENFANDNVVIILKDSGENDGNSVSFCFHVHSFVFTVVDDSGLLALLFTFQKVEIPFKHWCETVTLEQTNLFDQGIFIKKKKGNIIIIILKNKLLISCCYCSREVWSISITFMLDTINLYFIFISIKEHTFSS